MVTCQCGDIRDLGSVPRLGLSPGGRNGHLLLCSCLENPMDKGAWRSMGSPWGRKELDITEVTLYSLKVARYINLSLCKYKVIFSNLLLFSR